MGFLKDLFKNRRKKRNDPTDDLMDLSIAGSKKRLRRDNGEELNDDEIYLVPYQQIDVENRREREKYVTSLLETIADASSLAKSYQEEYRIVDLYLKDMEELEYISEEDKYILRDLARKVGHLELDKNAYEQKGQHLSDEDFAKAQRLEEEGNEGLAKIQEAEEYQKVIRTDLSRLESEKQANLYRKSEAEISMDNLRGMVQISTIALVVCMFVLVCMQFGFQMDTKIGYILLSAVYAVALAFMFLNYIEANKERVVVSRNLNKLVLLQNRVKIRYVNNTNLLEYLYLKYDIKSAGELEKLWNKYLSEKDERAKMAETMHELEFSQKDMVDLLRKYNFYDPMIWLHQTEAILNPKEMVEVRHALIMRRQKLRKQIEFNNKNSEDAKEQIKEMVGAYPQFAKEILKMVSDYEEEYPSL